MEGIEFTWNIDEFDALVRSCAHDDGVRLALQYMPLDKFILEAGCGLGRVVKYMQDRGYDIEGLELNAAVVEQIAKRFPDMRIQTGNVLRIPRTDACYGGIISFGVVEHFMQGPDEALREMFRVLQPGGVAVVTVPSWNALRRIKHALLSLCNVRVMPWVRKLLHKLPLILNNSATERMWRSYLYHVHPEIGAFFEYRFTPKQFCDACVRCGFQIRASIPISHWDGLYQEFGRTMCDFRDWTFYPTAWGKLANALLKRVPFSHNHMHACILIKPAV